MLDIEDTTTVERETRRCQDQLGEEKQTVRDIECLRNASRCYEQRIVTILNIIDDVESSYE